MLVGGEGCNQPGRQGVWAAGQLSRPQAFISLSARARVRVAGLDAAFIKHIFRFPQPAKRELMVYGDLISLASKQPVAGLPLPCSSLVCLVAYAPALAPAQLSAC